MLLPIDVKLGSVVDLADDGTVGELRVRMSMKVGHPILQRADPDVAAVDRAPPGLPLDGRR